MIKKGIINEKDKQLIISRISFYTKLGKCVKNSDLVIEAVTESQKIKLQIFKELDLLCNPKTILLVLTLQSDQNPSDAGMFGGSGGALAQAPPKALTDPVSTEVPEYKYRFWIMFL